MGKRLPEIKLRIKVSIGPYSRNRGKKTTEIERYSSGDQENIENCQFKLTLILWTLVNPSALRCPISGLRTSAACRSCARTNRSRPPQKESQKASTKGPGGCYLSDCPTCDRRQRFPTNLPSLPESCLRWTAAWLGKPSIE